ncbi:uncharacterized protein LOC132918002 isoform X2 [Rhopalosiphum padi]|uniref:uncharacterized protein LOC132918002 isoform X2 n=1 Tax=Rhopalosiphum padi TaxID=40932 RepID=UPI00298D726E|nr:uncharacterized protein LOC132918002 isoform X2 [Rhopalosiphum padi]XP_060835030.1 uncharacterized protein LOC132918002 isoform X2 [Rhopalosiphum padi]
MGYSLNVENLIHMAIDANNGHINQHFLVRLLKILVRHTNLDKYYVDFTGKDENRAHDVYTGIEDIITSPLNDAFEISYNEDDMLIPIKRPQPRPKKQITRQIGQYENFEESGMLEMNEEFNINPPTISAVSANQEMTEDAGLYERSLLSEDFLKRPFNKKPNETEESEDILRYTLNSIIEQVNQLTAKVKEMEIQQNATVIPLTPDCQNDSTHSCEVPNESFTESSVQTFYSSISVDLSEPENILQKDSKDFEKPKTFFNRSVGAKKGDEADSFFIIEKRSYDRLNLDENLKKLSISAQGDTILDVFGRSQKRRDLYSSLCIRDFRRFDLDYRTNFQTIHNFIELFKENLEKDRRDIQEIQKHLTRKGEYLKFKRAVMSTHIEIKDEIKELASKDPETLGLVKFVKDGTCLSCARPAMMKTTNDTPCCNQRDVSKAILQNKCRKFNSSLKKPVKTKYISSICSDIPMSTDQNKKKADLEYALDRYRKEDKETKEWIAWMEKRKCKNKNVLSEDMLNSAKTITGIPLLKPYSNKNVVSVPAVMPKNTNKYYNHKIIPDEARKPNIDEPSEEPLIIVYNKPSPSVTNFVPQPPIVFPTKTNEENIKDIIKNIKRIQKRDPTGYANLKDLEECRKMLDPYRK